MSVIVADIGSGNVRVGWASDALPAHVCPVLATYGVQPVHRGVVRDWTQLSSLWEQVLGDTLSAVDGSEHPVLIADSPTAEDRDRERLAELLFETHAAPAFFVASQPVLSVYSAGRTSAIVVDCGYGVTHAMAVHEGFAFPHTIMRTELGGHDLTRTLHDLLGERGVPLGDGPAALGVAAAIKESVGEVALDYAQRSQALRADAAAAPVYTLPDGQIVRLQTEHVRCCEALFQPQLAGCWGPGLADMVHDIIELCVADKEGGPMKLLPQFLLMVGGTSMLPGLDARLKRALDARAGFSRETYVSCIAAPERHHAAWVGGSIIGSLPRFVDNNFVHLAEYREEGPSAVHKRCC